jgi:hypothetical protein
MKSFHIIVFLLVETVCSIAKPISHQVFQIPRGGAQSKRIPANVLKYKLDQQHLLQLRSTYLSEALAARGIHVGPTLTDVSTPEGSKPSQPTDWDCCLSTEEDPKSCLYSFDAEPNTKVICPIGTTQYISLTALNRLRRTDPTKVEPMWHSQYAILKSWFSDESEFSLMQYVGWKGYIISSLLLDCGNGMLLRGILASVVLATILFCMPLIEAVVSRLLTSSTLWMKWMSWGRFLHAALPLKILIGQMAWKGIAGSFGKLESFVRDYIVELECDILEESIPVTVGLTVPDQGDELRDDALRDQLFPSEDDTDYSEDESEYD